MAKINIYPLGTPKSNDLLVGTSIPNPNTNKLPKTKNFSVSDVIALADIPFTSLTTNGTSGASTLVGGVLNVPNYATGVQSVVAGTNVTVDNNDPANPIINATGGITGSGTIGSLPIWTGTSELGDSFLQKGSTVDSLQTSNANAASGASSIAFHQNASATNTSSTAIGFSAVASNRHSASIGFGTEASGEFSMVFGVSSTATGRNSTVVAGNSADATGDYAVCGGFKTEAHDWGETVFGYYNKISTGSQTSSAFINDNNIFVVGNGSSAVNRSNALELSQRGELTLPYYPTRSPAQNPRRALGVESINGEVIAVDGPYWESPKTISVTAGGTNSDLDANSLGLITVFWGSTTPGGVFTLNLPDSTTVTSRTFKFVLLGFGRLPQQDVILQPFTGQTINGASSFTIPNGNFNVVEVWCNGFNTSGGDWVITSKLIN